MEIVLLILYLLALLGQILLLVVAAREPGIRRWIVLFAGEVVALAAALGLAIYFDARPGAGMMPGMTYFAEVIYSFGAAAAYGGMLLLSIFCGIVVRHRRSH